MAGGSGGVFEPEYPVGGGVGRDIRPFDDIM